MIQKKILKETVEHVTQIDGQQVTLVAELTFNHRNGQFTINTPIKTKAVSRDKVIQDAIIQQTGVMVKELFGRALELRTGWIQENPDAEENELQGKLPFGDNDEDGNEDEEGNERAFDDDNVQLTFSASPGKMRKSI